MFGFDDSPVCVVTVVISSVNWNNQYPITTERSYISVDGNFSLLTYCWWSPLCRPGPQTVFTLHSQPGDAQLRSGPDLVKTARPPHHKNLKGTWDWIILFAAMWNTLTLQRPKLKQNKNKTPPARSGLRRTKTFCEPGDEPGQSGCESDVKPNGSYKSWLNNIKQWRKKWLRNEINFPAETFSKSPSASRASRESLDQVR